MSAANRRSDWTAAWATKEKTLETEVCLLKSDLESLEAELADTEARADIELDRADLLQEQLDSGPTIPPSIQSALVDLCDPSKHGNSQAAQAVTAWLLEQRP